MWKYENYILPQVLIIYFQKGKLFLSGEASSWVFIEKACLLWVVIAVLHKNNLPDQAS